MHKQIYDMQLISTEELDHFTNREDILRNSFIHYRKDVPSNPLFEKVLTQLMAYQGLPPCIGTKYSKFLHFKCQLIISVLYDKDYIDSIYDYLETSKAPTTLLTKKSVINNL